LIVLKTIRSRGLFKGCFIVVGLLFAFTYLVILLSFALPFYDALYKWQTLKPQNYSVSINYGTYAGIYTSSRETVKNGVLLTSTTTTFTEPTIDRLFDKIRSCIFNILGILICRAQYDPVYGYPVRFTQDDLDLGNVIEITDFTPQ
jgi:hypothetical protein